MINLAGTPILLASNKAFSVATTGTKDVIGPVYSVTKEFSLAKLYVVVEDPMGSTNAVLNIMGTNGSPILQNGITIPANTAANTALEFDLGPASLYVGGKNKLQGGTLLKFYVMTASTGAGVVRCSLVAL